VIAAREHYKERGLPEGSHAEGAIFNSILGNKIPYFFLPLPAYLSNSVPYPGSGAIFTPVSGKGFSGSKIPDPQPIFLISWHIARL
jgi:hypothetical protein